MQNTIILYWQSLQLYSLEHCFRESDRLADYLATSAAKIRRNSLKEILRLHT